MKPARMGWVVESILDQIEWKIKINKETVSNKRKYFQRNIIK